MFKKESLLSCSVRTDVTDCTQDDLAEDRMTKTKDKCGGGNMWTISLSHEYIVIIESNHVNLMMYQEDIDHVFFCGAQMTLDWTE